MRFPDTRLGGLKMMQNKDVDIKHAMKPGATAKEGKLASRMGTKRDVLQGLQEEAKELLSLTYELNMDHEPGTKDISFGDNAGTKTRGLLKSPRLNIDRTTKEKMDSVWIEDPFDAGCKLLPGVSKSCGTEKTLDMTLSDEARERVVGNHASVDVIQPLMIPDNGPSYPLDLSVRDIQKSSPLTLDAAREGYREMLISLQHKYSVVLRMFEEINEQRMSYVEGIEELQGNLDNARSVLQLQKAEITKLNGHLSYQENVTKKALKDLERCNDELSESLRHEDELKSTLQEKVDVIGRLEADISEQQLSIDQLTKKINELSFMPKIKDNTEFADSEFTYEQAIRALWDTMCKLENPSLTEVDLKKLIEEGDIEAPLRYLETLYKMPMTNLLFTIYRYRFTIESKYLNDFRQMREDAERKVEITNERAQQLIDTYAARVIQANAENHSVVAFLNRLLNRRTIAANSKLMARIDKSIHKIDFGYNSGSYILYHELVDAPDVYPWHFFSIATSAKEYHMICVNDHLLDVLVLGLKQKFISHRFNSGPLDISQMRLLKAKTKLHYYCMKEGISEHRMWLQAIKKTIDQQNESK
eukprot:XP_001612240.1 hypothetical protein [Babesia bovis T2Bo]